MIDFIPSDKERADIKKQVNLFLKRLKNVKQIKFVIGGSYAKDTWLPGNRDVDVFAKFNYLKFRDKDISSYLFAELKKRFKNVEVVHGSRDYYHILINEILFEVVPVLDITKPEKALNVMDVSPLHVAYVKKKLKKKDDVRKLKALLKAQKLYGAESYIKGFSGYVLEILVSYYGSFNNLIKKARNWDLKKEVIDPAKHYKSKEIALKSLNKSKVNSPLVLVDPVQKERNAAAALSADKYKAFIGLCKQFDDSKSWFESKVLDVSSLSKEYLVLNVEPLDGKEDVILSKMVALLERIVREFKLHDFPVLDYGWDRKHFWFKVKPIEKKYKHYGPGLGRKEHVKAFKKKYPRKVKVEKEKVYVLLDRKYNDPKKFLRDLIKKDFVKDKVKKLNF